jgi:hypothetical protein
MEWLHEKEVADALAAAPAAAPGQNEAAVPCQLLWFLFLLA